MKETRILMGMPITLEALDPCAGPALFEQVWDYFTSVDEKFSTYKEHSEISRINRHELALKSASPDMRLVFELAEQVHYETGGYFDIHHGDTCDPSGLVKGWAIWNAAEIFRQAVCRNFYVDAGGDIQAYGKNSRGQSWRVGIRDPFDPTQIVKVLSISGSGIATSGTYIRGQHIYNPYLDGPAASDIVSLTVIGPDIYYADCFATAAFAMGRQGIEFIDSLDGFEGYSIDTRRQAVFTQGFSNYVCPPETH